MQAEAHSVKASEAAAPGAEAVEQVETGTAESRDTGDPEGAGDVAQSAESQDATCDDVESQGAHGVKRTVLKRRIKVSRLVAFGILPVLALLIASATALLRWQDSWDRSAAAAGIESLAAAKESTTALLSYQAGTVDKDLGAARDRLTGAFKDSYTQLVHDVVIPGAKKQHISATATVPAAASVSATPNRAVALVFVNQTVAVGNDVPTNTASAVRVTLQKVGERWLISGFDPV